MRFSPQKLLISMLFMAAPAIAGGQTGYITKSEISKTMGYIVFNVSGTPVSQPSCVTQPGRWALKISDGSALNDKIYALMLSAHASGKSVAVGGTGTCTAFPGMEDIDAVNMN